MTVVMRNTPRAPLDVVDALAGVCQLPQSPGSPIGEPERCVTQLGFVGCNLNNARRVYPRLNAVLAAHAQVAP